MCLAVFGSTYLVFNIAEVQYFNAINIVYITYRISEYNREIFENVQDKTHLTYSTIVVESMKSHFIDSYNMCWY